MAHPYQSSTSGYLQDSFEGIGSTFTDLEIIYTSKSSVVARAKRYGQWWFLKGLPQQFRHDEMYRQRLRKEFEVQIGLIHPGIAKAFNLEEVEGLGSCIVMEYIEGRTLTDWLPDNPERKKRLKVLGGLLDAVEYIHSKGIVHRDIKPDNIIVAHNGQSVRLIDFGLADTERHAVLKQPAGSPGYVSPEQETLSVPDLRNDIYSIGKVMKDMQLPYRRIIRKCTLPIDQRYSDIKAVRHAVTSHRRRPVRIAIVTGIAALCLYLIVSLLFLANLRQPATADIVPPIRDTLAVSSNTADTQTPPVEDKRVATLSDPLPSPIPNPTTANAGSTDQMIEEGKARLLALWNDWDYKRYLDTIPSYSYSYKDEQQREILKAGDTRFDDFPAEYVRSLGPEISEADRLKIRSALDTYHDQLNAKMYERFMP